MRMSSEDRGDPEPDNNTQAANKPKRQDHQYGTDNCQLTRDIVGTGQSVKSVKNAKCLPVLYQKEYELILMEQCWPFVL